MCPSEWELGTGQAAVPCSGGQARSRVTIITKLVFGEGVVIVVSGGGTSCCKRLLWIAQRDGSGRTEECGMEAF